MTPAEGRFLVADVGGTNTRIACFDPSRDLGRIARFANDDFDRFASVLDRFVATNGLANLAGCAIAVAGPVRPQSARLTNRDWQFSPTGIAPHLPGVLPESVFLLNDLAALGHALPSLDAGQVEDVRAPSGADPANDQALVAGVGTGFNVCLVKGADTVLEAELGHASLPVVLADLLHAEIGTASRQFVTYEALFSGRGLSHLFRILSGGGTMGGNAVLAAFEAGDNEAATRTVELAARLLGVLSRELVYQYLPFAGIHFAGGAARGILGSRARDAFLSALDAPGLLSDRLGDIPIRVITDDAAALGGAARVLVQRLEAATRRAQ